jgi:hypothetical protein
VSAVELAIKEVKKLSPSEAKELLAWLGEKKADGKVRRKKKADRPSMKKLKEWRESVRLTTGWEVPRMPDELVKPFSFEL